ncbi:uncharacterized protein LOC129717864 [Wyeomyia smithii]|uniref:uncharacterized protein LOC129717864 n=1 Tax=Wyeomyia smithii TaxID=174621 RepID=UPI0024680737|nr:uncharacterized protein LOC129717864 [Wyeomyia smithii]
MSKYITEDNAAVGYSSEQDEDLDLLEPKNVSEGNNPAEIYIGNTGKVAASKFFNLFRRYGAIRNMTIWRTHNHLYHARIAYGQPVFAQKAIAEQNNKFYNGKRLRISFVKDKITLKFAAAFRIDDLCAECTEEDIYEHFVQCGPVQFVVKTGFSAYVQMETSESALLATNLEMILNGDPYTLSRIYSDDRVDHVQVLENMRRIQYPKPFVMVENFPAMEKEASVDLYKSFFESIAPIQHFKIAPTAKETVTLALCVAKAEERHMLVDRFDGTCHHDKKLKLFITGARATMTIDHAVIFASAKTSVVVSGFPPYYKDYDVCKLFKKCGVINFLEKFNGKWLICFEKQSAVSLTNFYQFVINRKQLEIVNLTPITIPAPTLYKLKDYTVPQPKSQEPKSIVRPERPDNFIMKTMLSIDQNIKKSTETVPSISSAKTIIPPSVVSSKRPVLQPNVFPKAPLPTPSTDPAENVSDDDCDATYASPILRDERTVYIGNLAKRISEDDLRELFSGQEIRAVSLSCSEDSFFPSSAAIITFGTKEGAAKAISNNHKRYRDKRVMILPSRGSQSFNYKRTLMVKNLTRAVSEEGLLIEVEKVLGNNRVEDVIKPAHYYAYVELSGNLTAFSSIERLRAAFTQHQIDVYPLYTSVPKRCLLFQLMPYEQVRMLNGLKPVSEIDHNDHHFGAHNAHKLFVGNIPRDAMAEDVIDYFNNFGKVVDYAPIDKKSCYLRKSAILSFINSKHAQNAYQLNHFFEGSLLDVHLMDSPPWHFLPDVGIITVKFHSPFLTNDEIRQAFRDRVKSANFRFLRFDAYDDRVNLVVKYTQTDRKVFNSLVQIEQINHEAVLIVDGLELSHPTATEAQENRKISQSPYRQQKEKFLSYVVYKENLKEDLEICTKSNSEADIAFQRFYNDKAIQINNVSLSTTVEELRDLFIKCGDVTDYDALILEEDQSKICFITFDVDLAADLACTYNQRMLHGKRILIHLAKETVRVERSKSVLIEQLNSETSSEHIYHALSDAGVVKYVQKMSPFTAIVCFRDSESANEALRVRVIQNSNRFIVSPCYAEYDARFFKNFTLQPENISADFLQNVLTPRLRSEYHQSCRERHVLETLPEDVRLQLFNAITAARRTIVNFDSMSISEQITALSTGNEPFLQSNIYANLNQQERDKLFEKTNTLQPERTAVENIDGPSQPAKQPRVDSSTDWCAETPNVSKNAQLVAQKLPSSDILSLYSGALIPPRLTVPQQPAIIIPPVSQNMSLHPVRMMLPVSVLSPVRMVPPVRPQRPSGPWVQQLASLAYNATIPNSMNPHRPPYFRYH